MLIYNVNDWYWIVGGDETKVFSSARGAFVSATDPRYTSWATSGGLTTRIDTAANLGAVLAANLARPTDPSVLDGYQTEQATNVLQKAAFKVQFNHENRIRALEGKAAVSTAQAPATIKALM